MILHHGTTRARAEAIIAGGPDPEYFEPKGTVKADGFSMADPAVPAFLGTPERYAVGKARQCEYDGGPVVLEVDVPDEIANLANWPQDEYRFHYGCGIEELLAAWPDLPKRIIEV